MELVAKVKLKGYHSVMIPLALIYWELDDAAKQDRVFRERLNASLDKDGMINPIIITPREVFNDWLNSNPHRGYWTKAWDCKEPYRCWVGNNRLQWARNRGYEYISSIIVNSVEERDSIHDLLNMEYGRDF